MDPKSQALLNAALELPEADRSVIARELLATLPAEEEDGDLTEADWERLREDAKSDPDLRRVFFSTREEHLESLRVAIQEMREGKGVPVEEMFAEMRQILDAAKAKQVR